MDIALLAIGWVFIIATLLPFIKAEAWWIRVFDFPRSQIAMCGLASWVLLLYFSEPGTARLATLVILGGATLYQFWEMSAYTKLRPKRSLEAETSDPARRIRLLLGNVLMSNRKADLYQGLIDHHSPDIIMLAEPDEWWEQQLRPIRSKYPHSVLVPQPNTYGMLLYSKLPLSDTQVQHRVEPDVPSIRTTVTLRTGDRFDLFCLHPRPPQPGNDTDCRDAELVLVAKEIKDSDIPVIVCGDLNDVAWSHTTRLFLRLSQLLDPRLGRSFCNTFPANKPLIRWPLDHLFHSRSFRFVSLQRLDHCGSDHFPVLVELSYEPEEKHEQEPPQAEAEDHDEAQEKLENVRK